MKKIDFLKKCKDKGYHVNTVYMATKNPRINVKRIKERVKHGGHAVPSEKVIDRYYKSMCFLPQIIEISDEVQVFDNSYEKPFCVFIKYSEKMILLNRERREEWVNKYIGRYIGDKIVHDLTVEESSVFD